MKMYLKELTEEELEKVWHANQKLREQEYEVTYEMSMYAQAEDGELLLGKNNNAYSYHDNYSSFFFSLKDGYKFMRDCNLKEIKSYGLISEEQYKKYERANYIYEHYRYSDTWSDKLLDLIDKIAKEVLHNVEEYLHSFEDVTEEQAYEDFIINIDGFEDCYITSKEDWKLYRDIAYTKCFE